jgi:hypothetical protein
VQPYSFNYWSLRGKITHGDATHWHAWLIFAFNSIISTVTLTEMPIFEPNEFFWKNHWDGKEEKWEAYARVIREIIAKEGGFEIFDSQMEEKLVYKKLYRGGKPKVMKPKKTQETAATDDLSTGI